MLVGIDAGPGIAGDSAAYSFQHSSQTGVMTQITLIGDTAVAEFSPLIRWIRKQFPSVVNKTFVDIPTWERRREVQEQDQMTIVLQTRSDQFAPSDVDRLIGETLFSTVLCCFGSWCEGDGRSRDIWPHSTRVPLRYARQLIAAEVHRITSDRAALPLTAARDEVFLHRHSAPAAPQTNRKGTAVVISADRVYRSVFADAMQSSGWKVTTSGLGPDRLHLIRTTQLLVHDLDPQSEAVNASLSASRTRFPNAKFVGIAHMPQQLKIRLSADLRIVPKLDPVLAVEQIEQRSLHTSSI